MDGLAAGAAKRLPEALPGSLRGARALAGDVRRAVALPHPQGHDRLARDGVGKY